MAFEYFLYNTLYNNTLVDRSKNSFAPLPPNTGEIYIDYFIPEIQPLYLYRESGGTIVENTQENVDEYLDSITPEPTKNDIVIYDEFTGTTNNLQNQINGKLDKTIYQQYTGTTEPLLYLYKSAFNSYTGNTKSKLWNVFKPYDGVVSDDSRFEEYSNNQIESGQPIFFHDPDDMGFVFTGLTTTKSYNYLPWFGINGNRSAPRLKLFGSSIFTTSGIRGVELYIGANSNATLIGLSEHTIVDLTEIRFDIGGTGNTLTINGVNLTVGRIEGQTGDSSLIIKDRSNVQVQSLNEIKNVFVEGGSILTANWIRYSTVINIGYNGSVVSNNAIVTIAKPVNLTTGSVKIYGNNNILIASGIPIEIISGASNNIIIGVGNSIIDNGINTIILQNLTGGTNPSWGDISGTLYNQTDLWNVLTNKTDLNAFITYTGITAPARFVDVCGDTITGDLLFDGAIKRCIGRSTNDGSLSIYGGSSEKSGAYFQITGTGHTSSPYGGSAEFVIRNLPQSQFTLYSYDGVSTWTPRFSVGGSNGLVTINNGLSIGGATTGTTLYLTITPPSASIQQPTLFWNTSTKQIEAYRLTGGSDQYFYSECTTNRTTTSTTCVKAHGLTATTMGGIYEVTFSAEFGNATSNARTFGAFKIDNVTQGTNGLTRMQVAGANIFNTFTRNVTLTAGKHCFDIWYWNGGGTACVPISTIRVKRIG